MAFSASTPSSSVSEINVTPLIDVLLVLLIIFMVIVPVAPRGLDSSLPQGRAAAESANPPLVLSVTAGKAGSPPRYQLNMRDLDFGQLRPAFQQVFSTRQDHTVFVKADRSLSYGPVAAVVGEARAAGAGAVGFMPSQPH